MTAPTRSSVCHTVRLSRCTSSPAASLLAPAPVQGRAVLVFEVARPTLETSSAELAQLAKAYVAAGADALAVRTDSEHTPSGLRDLFRWGAGRGRGHPTEREARAWSNCTPKGRLGCLVSVEFF